MRDREHDNAVRRARRARVGRGDRTGEYAAHNAARRQLGPLPELFPDLARLTTISPLDEELQKDMRQQRALAELEARHGGRQRAQARCAAYLARERQWLAIVASQERGTDGNESR